MLVGFLSDGSLVLREALFIACEQNYQDVEKTLITNSVLPQSSIIYCPSLGILYSLTCIYQWMEEQQCVCLLLHMQEIAVLPKRYIKLPAATPATIESDTTFIFFFFVIIN